MSNITIFSDISINSLEIAEMVESQHGNVRVSIERLAARGVIQLPAMQLVKDNQSLSPNSRKKVYVFTSENKRDSFVVVAQLSPEFTGRLVDRWLELESAVAATSAESDLNLIDQEDQALQLLETRIKVANLLKVPEHFGYAEAVKEVKAKLLVDYSGLLRLSSTQENILVEDELLEPTELAARFGFKRPAQFNIFLRDAGWQVKIGKQWEPTEEGEKYCARHAWSVGTKNGYNLKWRVAAVENLIARIKG